MAKDPRDAYASVPTGGPQEEIEETDYEYDEIDAEIERRAFELRRIKRTIYFLANAIAILLLLSFALKALGANEENIFARFIYGLSFPFAFPFVGLFGEPFRVNETMVLDFSYLVAICIYYLVAAGLIKMISLYYSRYMYPTT
ncbi:MAG: hypothetical protein HC837_13020 [Chloroflexaceae bacterium]|nr:hypothetical protein [Chloroflexaceae bacterium]